MCCARSWATSSYHPGSTGVTWRPSPFPFLLGRPGPQVLAACTPGAPCPARRRPRPAGRRPHPPGSSRLDGEDRPYPVPQQRRCLGQGLVGAVRDGPCAQRQLSWWGPLGQGQACPSWTSPPPHSSIQCHPLRSLPAAHECAEKPHRQNKGQRGNRRAGRRWGGLAESRARIQRRGPCEGRLGDGSSPFTTRAAMVPFCE